MRDHAPKPISLEQQNRVLKLQIEAYKAAINWKMAELRKWEAGADPSKVNAAARDIAGWKAALDRANLRISEESEHIKQEDRCPQCIPTADFQWQSPAPAKAAAAATPTPK